MGRKGRKPRRSMSVRVYRALLRLLYPRGYLAHSGDAMEELFAEQLSDARGAGVRARVRLWLVTAWDLLASARAIRRGSRRRVYRGPDPEGSGPWRAGRGGGVFDDLALTLRRIARRPAYPLIAASILALGLSAGIAVFTYVHGFSQPFPGADPDGLVRLFGSDAETAYLDVSFLDFEDYAASTASFEGVAAVQPFYAASIRHEDMTEVAFLEAVTGDYFDLLDVDIALGRGLTAEDDRLESAPAAVISHAWWQSRFSGDPDVLGRTVYFNYRPFTVVGVAARSHLGSNASFRPHAWMPVAHFRDRYVSWDRLANDRDVPLVQVYARLLPGVTMATAGEEVARVAASLDAAYPTREGPRRMRLEAATWIDPRARDAERTTNRVMMIGAAGLLLLVCANVANFLLSVFAGRQHEVAMQAALGASSARLFRQVALENVLLSGMAGIVALWLAVPLSTRLGSYFARPSVWGENVGRELGIDSRVVLFALAVSLLTGLIAGVLPALRASRRGLMGTLKSGGAGGALGRRRRSGTRDSLVAAQVALSVLLLVVAGLVLRTLVSVGRLDPGFDYERLVGSHVSTSSTDLTPDQREQWFEDLVFRLSQEPWVESATVSQNAPLSPHPALAFRVEGRDEAEPILVAPVHPNFFGTMGIEHLDGRLFTAADTMGAREVAVVNQALADRYFPGTEAVGRRLWRSDDGGTDRELEIVGVVGATKVRDFLAGAEPAVYLPYRQNPYPTGSAVVVATNVDPYQAAPMLEQWLRQYEPHMAIVNVLPYREVVRGFLYTQRMNAEMFAALALLGLVLASVGIFAIVTLSVSRRTREIGVRKAVGARSSDINRLVVMQAFAPVGIGLAVGLGLAVAGAGLVRGLLHGVEPYDPATMVTGSVLLAATALAAAYLPARRAGRVDAVEALRAD